MENQALVSLARLKMCDLFTGADGGLAFVRFRVITDELAKKADEGDKAALTIIDNVILPFARLVDLAMENEQTRKDVLPNEQRKNS